MRIRSIKPEFWRSLDVTQHSIPTRLLFIGLWNYVDDNGVGLDSAELIRSDLFPMDDVTESSVRVHGGLTELSSSGQIVRYIGADGRPYLYISNWAVHQKINRPTRSNKPLPTSDGVKLTESSVSPHGALTEPSLQEQGSKGTRERGIEGGSRKRPSLPIPSDWVPNQSHIERARARGMNVEVLAEEIRNWAESKDERKVNWDAAFTNWINRADKKPSNTLVNQDAPLWQE